MNYKLNQLEPLLAYCEKPARYIGCERNCIYKPDAFFRAAVSYPDLYEIGMANGGVQILYEKANSLPDVSCERVFAPASDFFALLRERQMLLYTLESYTPLSELDSLSFNVAHELLYTNIAFILDAGGITLRADERTSGPIILAGGEAVSNPSVVATMADIIFAGEGDEGYAELLSYLVSCRKSGISRRETISGAESIEGVFVPANHQKIWSSSGLLVYDGEPVKRRLYRSTVSPSSVSPIVPTMRTGHERAAIEISRGCYNLCKFCHAGYYQLPYRIYDVDDVCEKTVSVYKATGYEDISYNSLSISDCRTLAAILNRMLPWMNREGLSLSLPSLKVDLSTLPIIEALSGIRRTSLTFAIETANDELRKCIHKRLSIDDVIRIVTHVVERGWRTIKFYFMLGLPGYTEHDEIESMISLLKNILLATRNRAAINVTISPFIPKPHTPFQYAEMAPLEYFQNAISRIKRESPKKITIKNHNLRASMVEAFLARGDIRTGDAVIDAYKHGCVFDSWDEHFKSVEWFSILGGYNKDDIYFRNFTPDGRYPWHSIDTGKGALTNALLRRDAPPAHQDARYTEKLATDVFEESLHEFEKKYSVIGTLLITLKKEGVARYISHLDMLEVVKRSMRIASIPMAFSQGFNKIERIVTTQPLTLGVESITEIFAVELYAAYTDGMCRVFSESLPQGFSVAEISYREGAFKNFAFNSAEYVLYFFERCDHDSFLAACATDCMVTKVTKKGERTFTLSECLISCKEIAATGTVSGPAVAVRLFTEGTFAYKADALIRQLLQKDPFSVAKIVKSALLVSTLPQGG